MLSMNMNLLYTLKIATKENNMVDFCCGVLSSLYHKCETTIDECYMLISTIMNEDDIR